MSENNITKKSPSDCNVPVDYSVGGGWVISLIDTRSSPITLVTFSHKEHGETYSRMDIGKRRFIDALPDEVSHDLSVQIVSNVCAAHFKKRLIEDTKGKPPENYEVGGGWVVLSVDRAPGPICSVEFLHQEEYGLASARMNINNRIFIDLLPKGVSENKSIQVALYLLTEKQESRI